MVERGLFIGRFQPFHYGHLYALKWILDREDEVIVAVGSAQYSHSFRNPFTLGERIEMIAGVLKDQGLWDRTIVCGVPDTDGRHALWVQLVVLCCPRFSRVYTNEPLSRLLFEEAGYPVSGVPFFDRERFEGTRIRIAMAEGREWRDLVPPPVVEVIEEIDGVERVSRLYQLERANR